MKPDVYFSKIEMGRSQIDCFHMLLDNIGPLLSQFRTNSFVGIKMTVGDEASTGYIKPEVVRVLVEKLKAQGAKPFVFDTNVIYCGQRQNSVDHLNLAYRKGFTPENLGCPYIIADSVFGTDSKAVKMDFNNIKEIKVPSLVKVMDDLIVLSHITGHIMSGFAGSIKNVAMGMASRAGKQIQHSSLKPFINIDKCTLCGTCIEHCPVSAISEVSGHAFINFAERMAEYARGILSLIKRKVFINFAVDITTECDCIAGDDRRIVEDTGILASYDLLAVDRAVFDMLTSSGDIFSRGGKITAHLHEFQYAQKIGLGSLDYNLTQTK
jgi:uncharacterized Fe-S center protein